MKRLTITYGGVTIHDADVYECDIKDSPSGITVIGKPPPAARKSPDWSALLGAARKPTLAEATNGIEETT